MIAFSQVFQGLGRIAQVLVVIGKVIGRTDDCDFKAIIHFGLSDARVQNGALGLGIGAYQDHEVCFIDAGDFRIEEVLCTEVSIHLGCVAPSINVLAVKTIQEVLEGYDTLQVLELTDDSHDLIAIDAG